MPLTEPPKPLTGPRPRIRYPEHEARHPWLSRLLSAYHLCDESTRAGLGAEASRRGKALACRSGCNICCHGQTIPVSDFEALGLWWYAAAVLPPERQERLRHSLLHRRNADGSSATQEFAACPFLLDGLCAIYPLRPFVCRQHHVFGAPCALGEDVLNKRPQDHYSSAAEAARDMAWEIIPLYGVAEDDVDRRFEAGYVRNRSKPMDTLPLENIIIHMDAQALLRKLRNA